MSFNIAFIPRRKTLGQIQVGTFTERFSVSVDMTPAEMERSWRARTSALLFRKRKVMLPVWTRCGKVGRAWLLYRVKQRVFIQDRVFFSGFDERKSRIPTRRTVSDVGRRISEWHTTLAAISAYVEGLPLEKNKAQKNKK